MQDSLRDRTRFNKETQCMIQGNKQSTTNDDDEQKKKSIIRVISLPSTFEQIFTPQLFMPNTIIPPCIDKQWAQSIINLLSL